MDHCPSLNSSIYMSKEYADMVIKYSNVTKYLENKTGLTIPNIYFLQKVMDVIICRVRY